MIRKNIPYGLAVPALLLGLSASAYAHQDEEQKIIGSDTVAGDHFGRSVAIDGDMIVAGAPDHAGVGAIYLFHYDGVEFHEHVKLMASDGAAGDAFGLSVAIHHDLIVVGAPGADRNGAESGIVYVFEDDGLGNWTEVETLTPTSPLAGDLFGQSVSIGHDNTVVVGAPRTGTGATGSAFVFVESLGLWGEEAEVFAFDGTGGNQFGGAVSYSEDVLVAGAIGEDGATVNSGAAYVYRRVGGGWSEGTKLFDPNGNSLDFYGVAVTVFEGTTIVIGASGDDDNGLSSGSAFKYFDAGGSWNLRRKFVGRPGDVLGGAVAHSYRSTLVGLRLADGAAGNSGVVEIHADFGQNLPIGYDIFVASDAAASDFLGSSVAAGECFVASGAIGSDTAGAEAGAVYVHVIRHGEANVANGSGINPLCMMTTEVPVIGADWHVEIDASAFPGAMSTQLLAVNQLAPLPIVRPFGEILISRPSGVFSNSTLIGSGINEHITPIPNDPYMIGMRFAAQGIVRDSGGAILGLCNAESLQVGCTASAHPH